VIEDATLSADLTGITDPEGVGSFSLQWLRNGGAIAGATGATYVPGDADADQTSALRVTYTDGAGALETLTSASTPAVANVNDAPTGAPVVTGSALAGEWLNGTATAVADADGLGPLSLQWLRDGEAIPGATGAAYRLTDADVGRYISVQVSYLDGHGTPESVVSGQGLPVGIFPPILPPPAPPVTPTSDDPPESSPGEPPRTIPPTAPPAQRPIPTGRPGAQKGSPLAAEIGFDLSGQPSVFASPLDQAAAAVVGPTVGVDVATVGPVPVSLSLLADATAETSGAPVTADIFRLLRARFLATGPAAATAASSSAAISGVRALPPPTEAEQGRDGASVMTTATIGRVTSVMLSAGFVSWALRGGGLMVAFLGSVPPWRTLDPLPILSPEDGDGSIEDSGSAADNEEDALNAIWSAHSRLDVEEQTR
jgi:hypothetical protein